MIWTILDTIFIFLVYIGVFALIYTLTWGFTRQFFKRVWIYYQVILGVIFGILAVIGQGLIQNVLHNTSIYIIYFFLPVIVCTILAVFVSPVSASTYTLVAFIGTFLVPLQLPNYFTSVLPFADLWATMVGVFILNISVRLIGDWYRWKFWTKWSLIALISFIAGSLMVIIGNRHSLFSTDSLQAEINVLIWTVLSYLGYGLCALIELIYAHATKLQNIIEYDHNSYLREALAHQVIYNLIANRKLTQGLYMTYTLRNIDELERVLGSKLKEKIVEMIALQVVDNFNNGSNVFFKANKNNFGVFIPIESYDPLDINRIVAGNKEINRRREDPLSAVEQKLKRLITTFQIRNYEVKVTVQAVSSVYGIQSGNLDVLKNYNLSIAQNFKNLEYRNKVVMVDTDVIKKINLQNRTLLALNQAVNIENITSLYYPIINIQKRKITNSDVHGFYSINFVDGNNIDLEDNDINQLLLKSNMRAMLYRINAVNNLKIWKYYNPNQESLVFINYDSNYLGSEDFSASKFIQKLEGLGISPEVMVLVLDLKTIVTDTDLLSLNILRLKRFKIKIAVKNLGAANINYSSLGYLQPDYGLLNETVVKEIIFHLSNEQLVGELMSLAKKLKFKIVAPYVNSYLIYKKLKSLKIPLMFGNLVGNEYEPLRNIKDEIIYLLNK